MRILGIDYGKKRVGLAMTDENGEFALPLSVLNNDKDLVSSVKKICEENDVKIIVLGESKNFSGEENEIMKDVKSFIEKIKTMINLPVILEPEFLTSAEASQIQGKNKMNDASSASLILKSYLDKEKNKK